MKSLEGKTSLVTGGTRGIGRATVLALAEAGANVAFNYHHSVDAAESLCREVKALGVNVKSYQADVSSREEVSRMLADVDQSLGPVHILVNNAGITRDKSFLRMDKDQWDEVLRVNLDGLFYTTQAVLARMTESGWGRIVNIASIVGQTGNFGQANYAASKGGMIAFTKSLAREVARKGVTVNAVAPGFIETDMTVHLTPEVLNQVKSLTPMARLGTAREVADTVAFLVSPRASYITGQVIAVNGGMYM